MCIRFVVVVTQKHSITDVMFICLPTFHNIFMLTIVYDFSLVSPQFLLQILFLTSVFINSNAREKKNAEELKGPIKFENEIKA